MTGFARLSLALIVCTLAIATARGADYAPDALAAEAYAKAKAAVVDGPNPKAGNKAAINAGRAKFAILCTACHGPAGAGDGPAAIALVPHPANLGDPARWQATSPAVKHWILMNGIGGTTMVPLGLTDDDAWNVLAFIQSDFAHL